MRDRMLSDLPEAAKQLVREMQQMNFGSIETLRIRGGMPVFGPETRVICEIKIGGKNGPRREAVMDEFKIKPEVDELFQSLAELGDGLVLALEVKFGLPFHLRVEKERVA